MSVMFSPLPTATRTDDDCAAITWRQGRRVLSVTINCYGTVSCVRCGLVEPPDGSVLVPAFEDGWRWLCEGGDALPAASSLELPVETQRSIGQWIDATFPGADPESPRKALRALEEMIELCLVSGASAQDVHKAVANSLLKENRVPGTSAFLTRAVNPQKIPAEAADVAIVLLGYAQLKKFDLQAEIDKKMAINRSRRWKANGDGTGYHIKGPAGGDGVIPYFEEPTGAET